MRNLAIVVIAAVGGLGLGILFWATANPGTVGAPTPTGLAVLPLVIVTGAAVGFIASQLMSRR